MPIICTSNSPKHYFNFPNLTKCDFNYSNNTIFKRFEIFKPNTVEFISTAYLCKKIASEISMYTDLSGYEHLIEKELNNKEISNKECQQMIKDKLCEFGTLKKGEHSYHTNNKISGEYPNRFTSLVNAKHYSKENCILIETKVFSHYDQNYPVNALADMKNCNYSEGRCQIKSNEIMIWEVNKDQRCKFISIGVFGGIFSDNYWINKDNQIALNIKNEFIRDCENSKNLRLTSEGYAIGYSREKRSPDKYVSTFQEAGELQYLENNFEFHMNQMAERFCQMFNDHNEILEILLKENPAKFIQKALNYSALDVKLINNKIIEVQFCKEINYSEIQITDLNDIHGYIPIKLKKYGDKIWYLQNNVIIDKIGVIDNILRSNLSGAKEIEIMKKYDLQFLSDKLIFKEHIFNDLKTNIEEELLNEMKQISNVEIELKENEQNSMIPHEIIDDVQNLIESYYIKYWRIYVTIGVTIVYILLIRSLFYIISPLFSINFMRQNNRPIEIELSENNRRNRNNRSTNSDQKSKSRKINSSEFPSITSLDQL